MSDPFSLAGAALQDMQPMLAGLQQDATSAASAAARLQRSQLGQGWFAPPAAVDEKPALAATSSAEGAARPAQSAADGGAAEQTSQMRLLHVQQRQSMMHHLQAQQLPLDPVARAHVRQQQQHAWDALLVQQHQQEQQARGLQAQQGMWTQAPQVQPPRTAIPMPPPLPAVPMPPSNLLSTRLTTRQVQDDAKKMRS